MKTLEKRLADLEAKLVLTKARLAQADGLWRYWRNHDITESEDEHVGFTDAVHNHLDGKPVDQRYVQKREKRQ